MTPVRRYACPRRCGRKTVHQREACCAECHWHAVDRRAYPSFHSPRCDLDAQLRRRGRALRPLPTDILLTGLLLYPQGLRIAECRQFFPEPWPPYRVVQRMVRKLRRHQMLMRVARGRYALTPRLRIFLWERGQEAFPVH
jgi:hypothetical protein